MPVLVVNVDHVATIRQARGGHEPDPVTAAHMAELAGAHGVIMHLREDRRHVQDRDVDIVSRCLNTRFHFEMAATDEMQNIALAAKPHMVCLVPEKREELTTEGGLAVAGREAEIAAFLEPLHAAGVHSSLFIEASAEQVHASKAAGAEYVELHTGHYADAATTAEADAEAAKIIDAARLAQDLGLLVNLGHGLNYTNIFAFKDLPGIREYSIGHAIISRAVFTGLDRAVSEMAAIIRTFAD